MPRSIGTDLISRNGTIMEEVLDKVLNNMSTLCRRLGMSRSNCLAGIGSESGGRTVLIVGAVEISS